MLASYKAVVLHRVSCERMSFLLPGVHAVKGVGDVTPHGLWGLPRLPHLGQLPHLFQEQALLSGFLLKPDTCCFTVVFPLLIVLIASCLL